MKINSIRDQAVAFFLNDIMQENTKDYSFALGEQFSWSFWRKVLSTGLPGLVLNWNYEGATFDLGALGFPGNKPIFYRKGLQFPCSQRRDETLGLPFHRLGPVNRHSSSWNPQGPAILLTKLNGPNWYFEVRNSTTIDIYWLFRGEYTLVGCMEGSRYGITVCLIDLDESCEDDAAARSNFQSYLEYAANATKNQTEL